MGYKENLNISGSYIFNEQIDSYFQNLGFYIDKMHPRFMNSDEYFDLKLEEPCLRFDGDWDHDGDGVQRVFMNKNEIYVERQTSYRSFDGSSHHVFEHPPGCIEDIEEILDELVKKYNKY